MLRIIILVKENNNEHQKYWEETFADVWEGPFEILVQNEYDKASNFDLIIFDLSSNENANEFISDISRELLDKYFLIVSNKKDVDLALNALKLGAIGYLVKPFKRTDLISCLDRLHSARKDIEKVTSRKVGKIITLTSYKGGTGVSTACVNLAYTFSTFLNKKTLIIDASGFANHACLLLNVIPIANLTDISRQGRKLDSEYLKNAIKTINKNLGIIGGLVKTQEIYQMDITSVKHMLSLVTSLYDYVFIDTSARILDEVSLYFIRQANYLFVLTTFELMAIKDTKFYIQALEEFGILSNKIKPVINRQELYRGNLEPELIQEQINKPIFHSFPNDWELCVNAAIQGRPFMEVSPNSKLSNSYKQLAEKIVKLEAEVEAKDTLSPNESTKKKSLLSWLGKND